MDDPIPKITIRLWRNDAIVLFDWLMSADLDEVPAAHPAVKQALTDLLSQLEQTEVPYGASGDGLTEEEIAAASDAITRDMGW